MLYIYIYIYVWRKEAIDPRPYVYKNRARKLPSKVAEPFAFWKICTTYNEPIHDHVKLILVLDFLCMSLFLCKNCFLNNRYLRSQDTCFQKNDSFFAKS